jgi:hypothetical protein
VAWVAGTPKNIVNEEALAKQ